MPDLNWGGGLWSGSWTGQPRARERRELPAPSGLMTRSRLPWTLPHSLSCWARALTHVLSDSTPMESLGLLGFAPMNLESISLLEDFDCWRTSVSPMLGSAREDRVPARMDMSSIGSPRHGWRCKGSGSCHRSTAPRNDEGRASPRVPRLLARVGYHGGSAARLAESLRLSGPSGTGGAVSRGSGGIL